MLHGYTLYESVFAGVGLNFGVGSAVSSIVWLTATIYWLSGFFYRLEGLQTLVAPVAAVAVLLPLVFPSLRPLANTEFPAFKAHISIAMLAYSLLTIAALHALFMAVVERRLHHPAMPSVLTNLPPLLAMERLLFRVIWVGFILLTLTLISGIVFSEEVFGQPLKFTHKNLVRYYFLVRVRCPAGGKAILWLARTHSHSMDTGWIRHSAAGLSRQQVCTGSDTATLALCVGEWVQAAG